MSVGSGRISPAKFVAAALVALGAGCGSSAPAAAPVAAGPRPGVGPDCATNGSAPVRGSKVSFGTQGPWPVSNCVYDTSSIRESWIVDVTTDEAQNRWIATPTALYVATPGGALRRYDEGHGLHLGDATGRAPGPVGWVKYCDDVPMAGDAPCSGAVIWGGATEFGIYSLAGGGPNEVFVGYHGGKTPDISCPSSPGPDACDPLRHSGKMDRVRLNDDGTITVDRFSHWENDSGMGYWHNRTPFRLLYDHVAHPGTLYAAEDHGIIVVFPDRFTRYAPPQSLDAWQDTYLGDHAHAVVCDHLACNAGGHALAGDWRGLALDGQGRLWHAGQWTAGLITWDANPVSWWQRWGGAFALAFGDPYTSGPGFQNEPVFKVPLEGDSVYLTAVSVCPDGRVWFASSGATGVNDTVAVWDGSSFQTMDARTLGLGERRCPGSRLPAGRADRPRRRHLGRGNLRPGDALVEAARRAARGPREPARSRHDGAAVHALRRDELGCGGAARRPLARRSLPGDARPLRVRPEDAVLDGEPGEVVARHGELAAREAAVHVGHDVAVAEGGRRERTPRLDDHAEVLAPDLQDGRHPRELLVPRDAGAEVEREPAVLRIRERVARHGGEEHVVDRHDEGALGERRLPARQRDPGALDPDRLHPRDGERELVEVPPEHRCRLIGRHRHGAAPGLEAASVRGLDDEPGPRPPDAGRRGGLHDRDAGDGGGGVADALEPALQAEAARELLAAGALLEEGPRTLDREPVRLLRRDRGEERGEEAIVVPAADELRVVRVHRLALLLSQQAAGHVQRSLEPAELQDHLRWREPAHLVAPQQPEHLPGRAALHDLASEPGADHDVEERPVGVVGRVGAHLEPEPVRAPVGVQAPAHALLPLEHEHPLSRGGGLPREREPADAAPDHDHVCVRHAGGAFQRMPRRASPNGRPPRRSRYSLFGRAQPI